MGLQGVSSYFSSQAMAKLGSKVESREKDLAKAKEPLKAEKPSPAVSGEQAPKVAVAAKTIDSSGPSGSRIKAYSQAQNAAGDEKGGGFEGFA